MSYKRFYARTENGGIIQNKYLLNEGNRTFMDLGLFEKGFFKENYLENGFNLQFGESGFILTKGTFPLGKYDGNYKQYKSTFPISKEKINETVEYEIPAFEYNSSYSDNVLTEEVFVGQATVKLTIKYNKKIPIIQNLDYELI